MALRKMSQCSLMGSIIVITAIRLAILGTCVILDFVISDHNPSGVEQLDDSHYDDVRPLRSVTSTFLKWDAVHYTNIAVTWYVKDYQFAFFPALPMLIWGGEKIISLFVGFHSLDTMVIFILSLNIVVQICLLILLKSILFELPFVDDEVLDFSLLVQVLNPATIFFTSVYTESIFALFTWLGIYLYFIRKNIILATCSFFVASWIRSNGSLNAIFIIGDIFLDGLEWMAFDTVSLLRVINFIKVISVFIILLPGLLWSMFALESICGLNSEAVPSYCEHANSFNIYSLIQANYWNVGAFRFYQWRQLPNILLGSPIILLTIRFFYTECPRLFHESLKRNRMFILLTFQVVVNMAVVLIFAHINIANRLLLSCSPLLPLIIAYNLRSSDWNIFTKYYVIIFMVFGIILHCNNFPWT